MLPINSDEDSSVSMTISERDAGLPLKTTGTERPRILYLTFDGLLEPLGRSQVLSYLYGLSRLGFRFTVISLERERDLAAGDAVKELEQELSNHGIRWVRYLFHSGSVGGVLKNCFRALHTARRAVRQDHIGLIQARSYVPALISWIVNRMTGVAYVFDMRGYWVDERAAEGRWFSNRAAYKIGKWVERLLLRDAAAIVTLTELQADDLRAGGLGHLDEPIVMITTCADYDEFVPKPGLPGVVPEEVQVRLGGKLVVGLVGSINASYCTDESLTFFGRLRQERPDAHLLCLTRQLSEIEQLLRQHKIPESAYTLASVAHQDMAAWLRHMDWALLLLNTGFSKRGSMPTKLAEFFAAGVRPIQYGCNEEVSDKVRQAGFGIVLESLSPDDLRKAAQTVAGNARNPEEIMKARESTRSQFGLEAGVKKYAKLFNRLFLEVQL